jgi:hypothetical protein
MMCHFTSRSLSFTLGSHLSNPQSTSPPLATCCGLEWLLDNPKFFFTAATTCVYVQNGTTVPVGAFRGQTICPCIQLLSGSSATLFDGGNESTCQALFSAVLVNSICANVSTCPPGTRMQPAAVTKVYNCSYEYTPSEGTSPQSCYMYSLDMTCHSKLPPSVISALLSIPTVLTADCSVASCYQCPLSLSTCSACAPGFFLFGSSQCVQNCPSRYHPTNASGHNVCSGELLVSPLIAACQDPHCTSCTDGKCFSCDSSSFHIINDDCVGMALPGAY